MPASGKYTLLGLEIETSCPATSSTTCSALLATRLPPRLRRSPPGALRGGRGLVSHLPSFARSRLRLPELVLELGDRARRLGCFTLSHGRLLLERSRLCGELVCSRASRGRLLGTTLVGRTGPRHPGSVARPPRGLPYRRAGQRLEPRRLALLREPAVQQLAARVAVRRGAEKRARYPLQRRRRRADARPTEDRVDGAHQDLKRPTLRLGGAGERRAVELRALQPVCRLDEGAHRVRMLVRQRVDGPYRDARLLEPPDRGRFVAPPRRPELRRELVAAPGELAERHGVERRDVGARVGGHRRPAYQTRRARRSRGIGYASGISRERRNARSRVTRGTLCTTLVAAMSSSAGSLCTSSRVLARAISLVIGQRCTRASVRTTSASSRSTTILPSCASCATSQSTIADMLQRSLRRRRASDGDRRPATASSSMCVSRFSTPLHARGHDVAADMKFPAERADEARRVGSKRDELRYRLAALGDDDPIRVDLLEQRQALLLEFRCRDDPHGQLMSPVS